MTNEDIIEQFRAFPMKLDDALGAAANWRTWMSDNQVPEEVKTDAFFIPMGDLLALVAILQDQYPLAIGIRAYVGMDESKKKAKDEGGSALKLMLVAVNPSISPIEPDPGKDIIEPITGTDLVTIFDFTSPCPKFCDGTSALLGN